MNINFATIIVLLSTLLLSCTNKSEEIADSGSGLIEITKSQFKSEQMEFGKASLCAFSDIIHITGTIVPTANGHAQISLATPGLIKKIYCKPGEFVNKGAILFEVSGNEFIDMQKDFAESAAILKRLKANYERSKELMEENIGSKKDFILAESEYHSELANYFALKLKLENIGLEVAKIETGEFYSFYSVTAPIKGYVSGINATIGQYTESQHTIAEIIDAESFQILLAVFEKDINKIRAGQNFEFYINGNKNIKYPAIISSVGKAINSSKKSIECIAEIKNYKNVSLVSNQFVEGNIFVATDSVISLPETAIIKSENEYYVLILEKEAENSYFFKKALVKTGRKNKNIVELTENPNSDKILISGIYNIQIN